MSEPARLPRAIDTFVNINMGSMARPPWLVRVAEDYFKRPDAIFKDVEMGELIDDMDRLGVERSVISTSALDVNPKALAFAAAHPDRFVLSVLDVVLGGGMSNLPHLYVEVPRRWGGYVFSDRVDTPLRPPAHGDSSGVRGAAWLWPA